MNLLIKVVKAAWNEISVPETFRKGEDFESYVRQHLFPQDKYTLLQRTHNYVGNKHDFVDNTKEPDFKFKSLNGYIFFLEAKYRSVYFNGTIEWCKPYQLKRYQEINRHIPVYIAIGIGQEPDNPAQIFLIPLKDIKYTKLFKTFLRSYEVPATKHICENQLV